MDKYLPPLLTEARVLDLQLWQWIGLFALSAAAAGVAWLVNASGIRVGRSVAARSRTAVDDRMLQAARGPAGLLASVLLFGAGTYLLRLPAPAHAFLGAIERALSIAAVTWLLARALDVVAGMVEQRLLIRGQALATSVVPLGRRTTKLLVTALAALAVLQTFGVNVTGLLAGVGIGGLAVALAAQKTVENLFAGISLIADQHVRIGDFCRFGDASGTVEEVGLRSTRIRTPDRTVVTIPNAQFTTLKLENFAGRDRIRFHATIGLSQATTPQQLRYVLTEAKNLVSAHPQVETASAHVRFVAFGTDTLEVEIVAYVVTADDNVFLAVQEDILLHMVDLVTVSGTTFGSAAQAIHARRARPKMLAEPHDRSMPRTGPH